MMKVVFSCMASVLLTSAAALQPQGLGIGDSAVDFVLKNVNGEKVSLRRMTEAKGFILIFTCNSCPYSVAYEDRIIALHEKYADKGYPVVAINPNDSGKQPKDSFEKMQERAKEKGFTFPYLLDETQEIAKAYGATRTPHVFLLDKKADGLKVAYIGAIDNNTQNAKAADKKYVEDAVENLLAGKSVSTTQSKAIGCTIKWRDG